MAVERIHLTLPPEVAGWRLDQALAAAALADGTVELSRRAARKLIAAGAVHVDRQRVRVASRPVSSGAQVEIYLASDAPSPIADRPLVVLYEDAHLVAVDKPSGLPVQATRSDAVQHLEAAVRRLLSERGGGPRPYLALHQRLDRGTSGVVLFAKRRAANAGLARVFSEHWVEKTYLAVCQGRPSPELGESWSVVDQLDKVVDALGHRRMASVDEGGRRAETRFRLLGQVRENWLVEARPLTGRTHQIRVHLAGGGLPVWGDSLYGLSEQAPRLMLHAWKLSLEHPLSGERLELESPVPEGFSVPAPA